MEKPRPNVNADTAPFWDGCNREELLYQHCTVCLRAQFYPRAFCAHCHTGKLEWRRSQGLGSVHSFTDVYRAPGESFKADTPYVIALIDVDEGFRIMTNLFGATADKDVQINARVRVVFEDRGGQKIPQFTIDR